MAGLAFRSGLQQVPESEFAQGRFFRPTALIVALTLGSAGCTATKTANVAVPEPTLVSSAPRPVDSNPYVSKPKVQTALASQLAPGGGYQKLGKPYRIAGKLYVPKRVPDYDATGVASWYGRQFHGRPTANGERFDMNAVMAAHPTMPLPSYARVTNLENGKSIIVRVNDRGPYAHGRLIDVSRRAATILDFKHKGTAKVRVQYVGDAPLHGNDERFIISSYQGPGSAPKLSNTGPATALAALAKPPAPRPGVAFAAALSAERLDRSTVDAGTPFDPFFSLGNANAGASQPAVTTAATTSYAAANRVSGAFDSIDNLIR